MLGGYIPENEIIFERFRHNFSILETALLLYKQIHKGSKLATPGFSIISRFLEVTLMGHIDTESSLDSKLQATIYVTLDFVLKIEILSKKRCS